MTAEITQITSSLIGYDLDLRDNFVYAPGQWETTLHCNAVSHWLGSYTKWSMNDENKLSAIFNDYTVYFIKKVLAIWFCISPTWYRWNSNEGCEHNLCDFPHTISLKQPRRISNWLNIPWTNIHVNLYIYVRIFFSLQNLHAWFDYVIKECPPATYGTDGEKCSS